MRKRNTTFLVVGILGVSVLSWFLGSLSASATIYKGNHFVSYLPLFADVVVNIVISGAFCVVVWLMLMKETGNKIPPFVMLTIGLLGLALILVYIFTDLYITAPWLAPLIYSPTNMIYALFVVFGIAGLFTKPKTNQPRI
jgi:hypothetical protein